MLVLDLQWLVFALLFAFVVAIVGAVWLDRRLRRKAAPPPVVPAAGEISLGLERAPFGLILLEDAHTYHYANPYAQRLLGLSSPTGDLPKAPWTDFLAADRASVRQEGAASGRYRVVSLSSGKANGSAQPDRSNYVR